MLSNTTVKAKSVRNAATLLLLAMALTSLKGLLPVSAQQTNQPGTSQMSGGVPGIPNVPGGGGMPMPPGGGIVGGIGGGGNVGGGIGGGFGGNMPPGVPGVPSGPQPLGMRQPGVLYSPNANQPVPLPPGDGPQPWPVAPGDEIAPLPPPTGAAGKGPGNGFPTIEGKDRTEVLVYVNKAMAFVIRPDQLSAWQIAEIERILKIKMLTGQQQIKVEATEKQVEEIQERVLNPYPNYKLEPKLRPYVQYDPNTGQSSLIYKRDDVKALPMLSGKSKQNPAVQDREKESLLEFEGPLPVIRPMCRWLILVGMVAATIWVATGALSVVLGHPLAGIRVAQAFFGLGLLLCAYTIYKIVVLNMMHRNSDVLSARMHRPHDALVQDRFVQPSGTPPIPYQTPITLPRPGIPVAPLAKPYNP